MVAARRAHHAGDLDAVFDGAALIADRLACRMRGLVQRGERGAVGLPRLAESKPSQL